MDITCDHLIGSDWLHGLLLGEGQDEEAIIDPPLIIEKRTGKLFGNFGDGGAEFEVKCRAITTKKLKIEFKRVHPVAGGKRTTTDYDGTVISFGRRGVVGVIKGKFTRTTIEADSTKSVTKGDWETERPT